MQPNLVQAASEVEKGKKKIIIFLWDLTNSQAFQVTLPSIMSHSTVLYYGSRKNFLYNSKPNIHSLSRPRTLLLKPLLNGIVSIHVSSMPCLSRPLYIKKGVHV